jgi:hypothetical protein
MNCQVCGNETFSDADICDDCEPTIPKATKTKEAEIIKPDIVEVHKCEGIVDGLACPNGTSTKYGSLWLCDSCRIKAKAESGNYVDSNSPAPETTTPTYDPDNYTNMGFEEVFKRIFNDYAPRVSELSDEALLQRIIYHRRAQEIDKTLEGIVLSEKERRLKTRKGKERDKLTSGIDGTKAFPTQSEQDKADKAAQTTEKKTKTKLERALARLVEAGADEALARKVLGI